MPPSADAFAALLPRLGYAVLVLDGAPGWHLSSPPPAWLREGWPTLTREAPNWLEVFPFLAAYAEQAEALWAEGADGMHASAVWTEEDEAGQEHPLEAQAARVEGQPLLLIRTAAVEAETSHQRLAQAANRHELWLQCIVHDLSSPLAGIRGALQLMQEDDLVRPQGQELLDLAARQADRLTALIRETVTTLSREIRAALHEAPVDVLAAAREAVETLEGKAERLGVELRLEVDGEPQRVQAQQMRLERVVYHLLDNALRYAPAGTEVVLRLQAEGETMLVTVDDAGPGVPEQQQHLFQKFHQGEGRVGNAGLGLYFCRIAAESWGGEVGYAPSPLGGARFWLRLPLAA